MCDRKSQTGISGVNWSFVSTTPLWRIVYVVICGSRWRSTNSCALLKHLHWLSMERCIKFKFTSIIYRTLSTTQPAYLYLLLKHYVSSCTLHFSDSKLLFVSHIHTCFGYCSFAVAASTIWNTFLWPLVFSAHYFRRQFKNFFLQPSLSASLIPVIYSDWMPLRWKWVSCWHCALYKLTDRTYVLSYMTYVCLTWSFHFLLV